MVNKLVVNIAYTQPAGPSVLSIIAREYLKLSLDSLFKPEFKVYLTLEDYFSKSKLKRNIFYAKVLEETENST